MIRLFALALVASSISVLHAQTALVPGTDVQLVTKTWDFEPTPVVSETRSLCLGDFNNDGVRDLAFIQSDTDSVEVQFSPQILPAFIHAGIGSGARDIAVVRNDQATTPGLPDRLVMVNGTVQIGTYSRATGVPSIEWTTLPAPAHWSTVDRIRVRHYSNNIHVLAGIRSDGTAAYIARLTLGGVTHFGTITAPGQTIHDLAIADTTGTDVPEIVSLSPDGLRYFSINATPLGSLVASPLSTTRGRIGTLEAPTGKDRVAWLTPNATDDKWLARIVAGTGTVHNVGLALGNGIPENFDLIGCTVADGDDNDQDDVFMTLGPASPYPLVMLARGSLDSFSSAYLAQLPHNPTSTPTIALAGDFDPVGGADVMSMRQGGGQLQSVFASDFDKSIPLGQSFLGTEAPIEIELAELRDPLPTETAGNLDLTLLVSEPLRSEISHLGVVVIATDVPTANADPVYRPELLSGTIVDYSQLPAGTDRSNFQIAIPDGLPERREGLFLLAILPLNVNVPENGGLVGAPELWAFTFGHDDVASARAYTLDSLTHGTPSSEDYKFVNRAISGPGKTVGAIKIRKVRLPPLSQSQSLVPPMYFHRTATVAN